MIGFDRPLKPRWIHEALQLWKPKTPAASFYSDFNQIVYELSGLEGKRKVRTVLFRYFYNIEGHASSQITSGDSLLASLSHKFSIEELMPTYLVILIDSAETLANIMENMFRLFPPKSVIVTSQLVDKTVEMHGERDVVKRSTRSFLMTLVHFGILRKTGPNYEWIDRPRVSCQAIACAITILCSRQHRLEADIRELPAKNGFRFINLSNVDDCAKRYNGVLWSYVRRPGTARVSIYQNAEEKLRTIQ